MASASKMMSRSRKSEKRWRDKRQAIIVGEEGEIVACTRGARCFCGGATRSARATLWHRGITIARFIATSRDIARTLPRQHAARCVTRGLKTRAHRITLAALRRAATPSQ
jgi:hypothetical protein